MSEVIAPQEFDAQFDEMTATNQRGESYLDSEQTMNALGNKIVEFTDEEIAELYGEIVDNNKELDEFSDDTLRNLGAVGVVMSGAEEFKNDSPETEAEHEAESSGWVYAQDQEAYKSFVTEAARIAQAAMLGDERAYGQLTPEFAELFKVRIAWNQEDKPSDHEFKAMVSTVCIDLYRKAYGHDPQETK